MSLETPHAEARDAKRELLGYASKLGFDFCGVAAPVPPPHSDYLDGWLERGEAGDMTAWMGRDPEARKNPTTLLPGAQSLIVLGINYFHPEPDRRGRIAKYAMGRDYHDWIPQKLKHIDTWLQKKGGTQRVVVDTSPILEKPAAVAAGLGWQGKSTIFIHRKYGTWSFLAEVLTTLKLPPDPPEEDHCGSCTRCIDVCPTQAITGPYQLDARKCISYLTIEHKGSIPVELRKAIGDHLFGCDDCLDVCPWNRWAQKTKVSELEAIPRPDLVEMLGWDDATFRNAFRGTPVFRLKRPRWLRNICVVLGNVGTRQDLPALEKAARDDDQMVREHAQWAIGEIQARIQP